MVLVGSRRRCLLTWSSRASWKFSGRTPLQAASRRRARLRPILMTRSPSSWRAAARLLVRRRRRDAQHGIAVFAGMFGVNCIRLFLTRCLRPLRALSGNRREAARGSTPKPSRLDRPWRVELKESNEIHRAV